MKCFTAKTNTKVHLSFLFYSKHLLFFFGHQVFSVNTFGTASLFSLSYEIGPRTKDHPNGSFYTFLNPYYLLDE